MYGRGLFEVGRWIRAVSYSARAAEGAVETVQRRVAGRKEECKGWLVTFDKWVDAGPVCYDMIGAV